MDQLRNALSSALGTPGDPAEAPLPAGKAAGPPGPPLPDPLVSDWVAAMRRLRVEVPREPTLGQLTQRSDAACRQMEADGHKREARELRTLKQSFLAQREKVAWGLVKDRFAELGLSEKSYRALKQEGALAEKVLAGVWGKRGEALRGAGHTRVKELLLPEK